MNAKDLKIGDILIGDSASFEKRWSAKEVDAFAKLSGDENPLHTDESYAKTTVFGRRLVHGMLVASSCSALVGMRLPGKRCLYLKQSLVFKKPVFIGDNLIVRGTVAAVSPATGVVDIDISISKGGEEVLAGTATVQVMP